MIERTTETQKLQLTTEMTDSQVRGRACTEAEASVAIARSRTRSFPLVNSCVSWSGYNSGREAPCSILVTDAMDSWTKAGVEGGKIIG